LTEKAAIGSTSAPFGIPNLPIFRAMKGGLPRGRGRE
jgi:hypothetical protein